MTYIGFCWRHRFQFFLFFFKLINNWKVDESSLWVAHFKRKCVVQQAKKNNKSDSAFICLIPIYRKICVFASASSWKWLIYRARNIFSISHGCPTQNFSDMLQFLCFFLMIIMKWEAWRQQTFNKIILRYKRTKLSSHVVLNYKLHKLLFVVSFLSLMLFSTLERSMKNISS